MLTLIGKQMITPDAQLFQFTFKLSGFHAQVEQRANQHVAADAAEDVEVKGFHLFTHSASSLIWLAA